MVFDLRHICDVFNGSVGGDAFLAGRLSVHKLFARFRADIAVQFVGDIDRIHDNAVFRQFTGKFRVSFFSFDLVPIGERSKKFENFEIYNMPNKACCSLKSNFTTHFL